MSQALCSEKHSSRAVNGDSGTRMYGEGDIQMQWLLTPLMGSQPDDLKTDKKLAFQVERWREALLWTYCVTNLGTMDIFEQWTDAARREIMDMFVLGPEDEDVTKIEVHLDDRCTLEHGRMEKVFEQTGWEAPKATDLLFCEHGFDAQVGMSAQVDSIDGRSSAANAETESRSFRQ